MDILTIFTDAFNQLIKGPVWVLISVALIAIGYGLKAIPQLPNKLIPALLMLLGAIFMAFLANPALLPPDQRHPYFVFALMGLVLGAVAWACHGIILKRIEKKFGLFQTDDPNAVTPTSTNQPDKKV